MSSSIPDMIQLSETLRLLATHMVLLIFSVLMGLVDFISGGQHIVHDLIGVKSTVKIESPQDDGLAAAG